MDPMPDRLKSLDAIGGALALAGVLTFALSTYVRLTLLGSLGIALLGAGVIFWGMDAVMEGRIRFTRHRHIRFAETYSGLAARAWGLVFAVAGFLLLGFGLLSLTNPRTPVSNSLLSFFKTAVGTSVLLIFGGLLGGIYALTLIFGSVEQRGSIARDLLSLPSRLWGLIVLLLCLGLIIVGMLRFVAPEVLDNLINALIGSFQSS